ncbi:MAG TPA: sigma-70 family RNA polymerase sigma factor [Propionicimonas sp.]|jgi:RNA polymerase sigma factor (sigma-70 family)|nr:sigma-70 family RNA polymerase sigma factor [Propionicimonas sp.]
MAHSLTTTALLDAEQEVRLARRIEAGLLAARALEEGSPIPASPEELRQLVVEGRLAWDRFLLANTRLVWLVVRQSSGRCGISDDDLFQEGFVMLARALQRFDHTRGRFSTYALPRIQSHLAEVTSARAGGLGIPTSRALALRRAQAIAERVSQVEGRRARLSEVATAMGREEDWTGRLLQHRPPVPLELVGDLAAPSGPDVVERLELQRLARQVERLPEPQREVVRLRFGFTDGICRSYRLIATVIGMSTSSVRRLEQQALAVLRSNELDQLAG